MNFIPLKSKKKNQANQSMNQKIKIAKINWKQTGNVKFKS